MVLAFGGQWGWGAWAWLIVPVGVYSVISLGLFGFGRTDEPNIVKFFFSQISDSLERLTGFPGWSMAGVLSGLMSLLIVVIGFYWDVAWHIDFGRDTQLFTPPHVMILVGLGGLVYTAVLTVVFTTVGGADVGFRVGSAPVPWSALLLGVLGAGAIAGFPLDNLWHKAYGIDVTLWSPTHLQLVGGGSLGTVALLLMCAEALPGARPNWLGRSIMVLTAGTVLVGLSTFQGEFDFGVPQFQAIYLPVLMMAAAGFALVVARLALGPWGAVKAALVYLVLRVALALVVGGALHHTVPHFPLYLPSAVMVEAAAWIFGTRRLHLAVGAGVLVGTVGLAGELGWVSLSGWSASHLPMAMAAEAAVLGPLAAVAAAVLGAGLGRAFTDDDEPVPVGALLLAGVVLFAVLAYPLPRRVGHVAALIAITPAGGGRATVEVDLEPAGAAHGATAFAVTSWQGGGRVTSALDEIGPDRYRSAQAVPITGRWKTVVSLMRGDQVMAAPVYLPADPQIGAPAVPALPLRRTAFVRNTTLLLREKHPGPAWVAWAAYSGLATLMAVWVGLMALTARRLYERDAAPALPEPTGRRPLAGAGAR